MPRWKPLPGELDPDIRAFTERLRRLIDRSGLGVVAVAERTGHERAAWDTYLSARLPVPRSAVVTLAEATGSDIGSLAAEWERAERAWSRTTRQPPAAPGAAPAVAGMSAPEATGASAAAATLVSAPEATTVSAPEDTVVSAPAVAAVTASEVTAVTVPAAAVTGSVAEAGDDRTMEIRRLDRAHGPGPAAPPSRGPAPTPSPGPTPPPSRVPAPAPAAAPSSNAPARRPTVLLYAAGILGALLVVTAALLLVDLGGEGGAGGPTAAPPVTTAPTTAPRTGLPAGVKCAGADCAGRDPEAMGCGGPLADTVARTRVGAALVEVRHSATCAAVWARITGAAPGDTVTVEAAGAVERAVLAEGADNDAYTPMLAVASAADARACGTLVDGRVGCTVNP
ncbi:DUF2690 domain-containing protein [Streptomyces sp. NPDC059534]|uniref:DUF2690 domain-containing protein n=1 Tax=Streptomyces sp. NPDC059534 TaxID=3346859 RepID=UPI0036AC38FF